MSLLDRVTAIFKRTQPPAAMTTAEYTRPVDSAGVNLAARFSVETSRAQIVRASREMYRTDPRAKGVIRTLARDMVKRGFTVRVANPRAEAVANELINRIKLFSRLDDWVRLTLRDGDSFLEIGVDNQLNIAEVTRKPSLQMHRNSDETDRFTDPERAFWWADEAWIGQLAPVNALWFGEWQIIHARWDQDEGNRYGDPLFTSALGAWKRIKEGEIDIAVRRKTRAGMRYIHALEGADDTDIERYKEKNREALNPNVAIADFFTNKKATITAVQGDAQLGQIDDVMHHIRTWWVASPAPMSLLGYGQDLNRDVLEEQQEQYFEALEPLTQWVEDEIVRPLLERQWLLAGILPEGLDYEIVWASKKAVTAADLRDAADAALRMQALGLSDAVILAILQKFLPDIDLAAALSQDGQDTDPARMADAADQMIGGL